MDNRANEAYLTAIIDGYQRKLNKHKGLAQTTSTLMLKEVVATLEDLASFIADSKATESKSTLELNKDLTESARAYKTSLETISQQECTITTQAMDLYDFGYIEKENKMLEADNLKLNNQLALQESKRIELFEECSEAEIENGNYVIEIQELKFKIKMWNMECERLRTLNDKLTKDCDTFKKNCLY